MAVAFGTSSTASHSNTYVGSLSINKPASTANGDLLILAVETSPTSQSGPTVTAPSGWTAVSGSPYVGSTGSALWVWYKIASSEGSSYSLSFSPTIDDITALIARYTGVDNTSPITNTGSTTASNVTSKAVAAPTGIATGGVSVMIGGARPDSGTASLTITMPGTSRVASFYASAGSSDYGAGMALSDSTSTASGNMTVNHSSEVSELTLVLAAASGGTAASGSFGCTLNHVTASLAGSEGDSVTGSFSCILGAQCSGGGTEASGSLAATLGHVAVSASGTGSDTRLGKSNVFYDDFATTIDTTKWRINNTSSFPNNGPDNPGDHKVDYFHTGQVASSGGNCVFTAQDAGFTISGFPQGGTKEAWYTAFLTTEGVTGGGFQVQTGDYLEGRFKLPAASGAWPALWTWGSGSLGGHGEVDIFEYHPDNAHLLELSNHVNESGTDYTDSGAIAHDTWVTIGTLLGETSCDWYVNGARVYQDGEGVGSDFLAYINLNLSLSDGYYHPQPSGSAFTFTTDYVGVWR
jgi:hypothetical protein